MAKQELLEEAAELGIEGVDESFTVAKLRAIVAEAREAQETAPEAAVSDPDEVHDAEDVGTEEAAPAAPEPVFTLEQLFPYAEGLFGVGQQVLVGARSAGFIPGGRVTKEQVIAGITQYLNMPVEKDKEG